MVLKSGGSICYLGCPSLAIWHTKLYPSDKNWFLLDQGHFALKKWKGNIIPESKYREYNVFNSLPSELERQYSIVITDPPWYVRDFELFWKRANQLVKPKGIIGITYYPEELDKDKSEKFWRIIFRDWTHLQFGSFEIDYTIPEFEKTTGVHLDHVHLALKLYRQGHMDFYFALSTDKIDDRKLEPHQPNPFEYTFELEKDHHIRCRQQLDHLPYPIAVSFTRVGIKRIEAFPEGWFGITTKNVVVKIQKNGTIKSKAELLSTIEKIHLNVDSLKVESPPK
jgi:hypothetical protein